MLRTPLFIAAVFCTICTSDTARAWYDHEVVMKGVQLRLEKEVSLSAILPNAEWTTPLATSSDNKGFGTIAGLLLLQKNAELKSNDAKNYSELLRMSAEDPDHGIDRNLPDSADPSDDRKYMGGTEGANSQGFRHMFWSGWNWKKPISTFQYPPHAIGQAVDRFELLSGEARDRIRKGDISWGLRILGWSLHYLQDLTQPFHTVQFPALEMLPLKALITWPPTDGFSNLIAESTRIVTNYHWAYEGYVRHALLSEKSPFTECFQTSGGSLLVNSPRELALEIVNRSIKRAPKVGDTLLNFVGRDLKKKDVSVPINPAIVDVQNLLTDPAKEMARSKLNQETCESLRLATDASIWIVRWAFAR